MCIALAREHDDGDLVLEEVVDVRPRALVGGRVGVQDVVSHLRLNALQVVLGPLAGSSASCLTSGVGAVLGLGLRDEIRYGVRVGAHEMLSLGE
jgi:hypothetical protein